ncbi:ATP-binding cassette domain-containing protein [Pararhizobium sp.]|uniref:ATP-binding cassette domain-containing protein n=1 Tax=Pararhizobium sp. TaxID=1977563 RepID=UPI00138F2C2E
MLEIGPGETFGLIGESGLGKSTLTKIIAGLQTANSGTIELPASFCLARPNAAPPQKNVHCKWSSSLRT